MSKLAIRLLILSMSATALLAAPIVTTVKAATNSSKEIKKKKKVTHRGPAVADPSANPFSSNIYDDFDRRNAGGGGGY